MRSDPEYHERARLQCLAWVEGKIYHNQIDDECCPDFSCCIPDLFEVDQTKRWKYYHRHHGNKH